MPLRLALSPLMDSLNRLLVWLENEVPNNVVLACVGIFCWFIWEREEDS